MKREYQVEVAREGRWWMIRVPEIDQITQARRLNEVEEMARDLIAISTDSEPSEVTAHIVRITVPGVGDVLGSARQVEVLRQRAEMAEKEAATAVRNLARDLTGAGIPVRDAAELLHVSPQRISQLTSVRPD